MKAKQVPISEVRTNEENPRTISKKKLEKLQQSIQEFPEMLELRPIVVDADMVVLGGNQRLAALQQLGYETVWVVIADQLTEEQKSEFIIKDNLPFGEWDWDELEKNWDAEKLEQWGLDVPGLGDEPNDVYTSKIEAPTYEPKSDTKPGLCELVDTSKMDELVAEIEATELDPDEKKMLKLAAMRHCVFDYGKIAEYYAHSSQPVQELMEKSALVIIDFDQAIELGYVQLSETLSGLIGEDYGE